MPERFSNDFRNCMERIGIEPMTSWLQTRIIGDSRGRGIRKKLESARKSGVDITADVYPYRYWQSGLTVLFPGRDFTDRAAAEFALREVAQPDSITLTKYGPNPAYQSRTVGDVARLRGTEPATTLMALIRDVEEARKNPRPAGQTIIATSMVEPDIERILAWPFANVCTDGELDGRHPRGFGSFPRVLGDYVRQFASSDSRRRFKNDVARRVERRDREPRAYRPRCVRRPRAARHGNGDRPCDSGGPARGVHRRRQGFGSTGHWRLLTGGQRGRARARAPPIAPRCQPSCADLGWSTAAARPLRADRTGPIPSSTSRRRPSTHRRVPIPRRTPRSAGRRQWASVETPPRRVVRRRDGQTR